MPEDQQPPSFLPQPGLGAQNMPDRRLSRLEVSLCAAVLACLLVFASVFLKDRAAQNQADQMIGRAQAVTDWLVAAHSVRTHNAGLEPVRCRRHIKQPLSSCFQDMVSSGQPLAGLINIYASDQKTAPAFAFVASRRRLADASQCSDLPAPVFISAPMQGRSSRPGSWAGLIIVQPEGAVDDLSVVVNSLSVGYCDRQQMLVWTHESVPF